MREEIKKFFGSITPLLIFFMLQISCDLVSCKNQVELRKRLEEVERGIAQQIDIIDRLGMNDHGAHSDSVESARPFVVIDGDTLFFETHLRSRIVSSIDTLGRIVIYDSTVFGEKQ